MSYIRRNNGVDTPAAMPAHPANASDLRPQQRKVRNGKTEDPAPDMGSLILVVDSQWRIVAGDPDWHELPARDDRELDLKPGQSFKRHCEWCVLWGAPEASIILQAMRAIDSGARQFSRSYKLGREHRKLSAMTFDEHGERFCVFSRLDLTELFGLRRDREQLESRLSATQSALVQIREDERDRIARELHDNAAQCLVGIRLGLGQIRLKSSDPGVIATAAELTGLVEQFQSDLRVLTYTLYPPLIEQLGLHRSLQVLCATFMARTGIEVRFAAYEKGERRPGAIEAAIYRLVQEALSNVHKHASASRARVRLMEQHDNITVAVMDDGIGMEVLRQGNRAAPLGSGLGIPGMTSRAHELGGRAVVHSRATGRGTIMAAVFPRRCW